MGFLQVWARIERHAWEFLGLGSVVNAPVSHWGQSATKYAKPSEDQAHPSVWG